MNRNYRCIVLKADLSLLQKQNLAAFRRATFHACVNTQVAK